MQRFDRRGLHEHVIDQIGRSIVSGEFAPGTTLPSEAECCRVLGVSRTALREALRVLAAKGLIEARPKVGTLVLAGERWNHLDADVLSWRLQTGDSDRVVDELYELRHLIEPTAASLAAKSAKAEDIALMREAYQEMQGAGDDGTKIVGPDLKFHRAIITASGNALFSSLAHVLTAALSVNFDLVREVPGGQRHSMAKHKKVLDSIANHDAVAARLAMQSLIEDSHRDACAMNDLRRPRGGTSKPRKSFRRAKFG